MNDKLKQRLAGAAVLLVATFIVVSLLPTPEQAAHQGDAEVVTIPLHDVVSASPPPMASTALPQTLAAPTSAERVATAPASANDSDSGDATLPDSQDPGSSGDDDAVDVPVPEARKPATLPPVPVHKPDVQKQAEAHTATAGPVPAQRWFVQVGGFADIDNARKVQLNLKSAGQPNVLAPIETGKGTIYRVRAGPYANQAAAQQAFDKIKALGYPGSQLIEP